MTRRPTKAKIQAEAKKAALELAADRLLKQVKDKVPALLKMVGMSEEKADLLHAFISEGPGDALVSGVLAGIASFVPVPEKYEKHVEALAELFRIRTMRSGGNAILDLFTPLITDFIKDIKKTEDSKNALESAFKEIVDFADIETSEEDVVVSTSARSPSKKKTNR